MRESDKLFLSTVHEIENSDLRRKDYLQVELATIHGPLVELSQQKVISVAIAPFFLFHCFTEAGANDQSSAFFIGQMVRIAIK